MIKRVKINNFRCLHNLEMSFEDDLTIIVGENDAGKTSMIDALRVALLNQRVDNDDFYNRTDPIEIEIELDDNIYLIRNSLDENGAIKPQENFLLISKNKLNEYRKKVNDDNFIENDENKNELRNISNILGISYRSNSAFNTLKTNINEKINTCLNEQVIDGMVPIPTKDISIPIYVLDGKHFDDITLLINELFFKDKKKAIWSEPLENGETVQSLINNKLKDYETQTNNNINEGELISKIKQFLPSLTKILISSEFELRDINFNINVKFLENEKEISVNKKGDGTKRRITMALLDYKNVTEDNSSIYIFDEPDTHLHVKAQKEYMEIVRRLSKENKQVIITTHSPFIINSCNPNKIRLLVNNNNKTSIKYIKDDKDVNNLIRNIGIENIYLFFAKNILIVEGETEETFIPIIFERKFNENLYSHLTKIINVKGIKNVYGFSQALLKLYKKDNIYILIDNDADENTTKLLKELDLCDNHLFRIGNKEFEDSFQASTIYNSWKEYIETNHSPIGPDWSVENIQKLKDKCINTYKFSDELKKLNTCARIQLTKVNLGHALGDYCDVNEIDSTLIRLLEILHE